MATAAAQIPGRDYPEKIAHIQRTRETAQANYRRAALESAKGNITDEQLEQAEKAIQLLDRRLNALQAAEAEAGREANAEAELERAARRLAAADRVKRNKDAMAEEFAAIAGIIATLSPRVQRYLSLVGEIASITAAHREVFSLDDIGDLVRPLRADFSREANFILGQLAGAGMRPFGIGDQQAWQSTGQHETSHVLAHKLQAASAIESALRFHDTED